MTKDVLGWQELFQGGRSCSRMTKAAPGWQELLQSARGMLHMQMLNSFPFPDP